MNNKNNFYRTSGFVKTPWEKVLPEVFKIELPNTISGYYLSSINIYSITRKQFGEYLSFFSSYSEDYKRIAEYYQTILSKILVKFDKLFFDSKLTGIEMAENFQKVIREHYSKMKTEVPNGFSEKLLCVYDAFFKDYEFFRTFFRGFDVKFSFNGQDYLPSFGEEDYRLAFQKYPKEFDPKLANDFVYFYKAKPKPSKPNRQIRAFPIISPDTGKTKLAIFDQRQKKFIAPGMGWFVNPFYPKESFRFIGVKIDFQINTENTKIDKFEIDYKDSTKSPFYKYKNLQVWRAETGKYNGQFVFSRIINADSPYLGSNLFHLSNEWYED